MPVDRSIVRGVLGLIAPLALSFFPIPGAAAEDLLPADKPIPEAIDHYLAASLAKANVSPAQQVEDATYLRRVMLDLVGRIPTPPEAKAFAESQEPDKRAKLVDELMASPSYARYQAYELDLMLMPSGKGSSLKEYLNVAVTENRSWDRIFRELLQAEGAGKAPAGAELFLKERVSDLDKMTNDVSILFFGVNIGCAMCHDHPLVGDWSQGHFYGMKSFFSRSYEVNNFVGERSYGGVTYKTTDGESRDAKLMFLTGEVIAEPAWKEPNDAEKKKEKELIEELKKKKEAPPKPEFSRRAKLVEIALAKGKDDFFSRSMVNRLWTRLYGHGLVDPVDQMHSGNKTKHPELLTWLARDFSEHGYDLKRVIRGLVLSQTYGRSSRWENGDRPKPEQFATALSRPLTPVQYAVSLKIASMAPSSFVALEKKDEARKQIEQIESSGRGMSSMFEVPGADFQVSADEALAMTNSSRVESELLVESKDRIVGHLLTITDERAMLDTAMLNILGRLPEDAERQALSDYLSRRTDRRPQAVKQVVWALLTDTEFRFNY